MWPDVAVQDPRLLTRSWSAAIGGDLASRAVSTAGEVADRLTAAQVQLAVTKQPTYQTYDEVEALAGAAMLHAALGRPALAHACLAGAVGEAERLEVAFPGPFGGLASIAYAARALSPDGTKYQRLLATLDGRIASQAGKRARFILEKPYGLSYSAYDAIGGLAGSVAYLLSAGKDVDDMLSAFVALTGSHDGQPNWFTPAEMLQPHTSMGRQFPSGVCNTGLAHGIAGPLSVLSLASLGGLEVPGQPDAISTVAHWLAAQRSDDAYGPNWPHGVRADGWRPPGSHSAWCYGGPGVARALWLAGRAIDNLSLRTAALEAMAAVYRRPWDVRDIGDSSGLCHGVAGLLQIVLRFSYDTGEPFLADFSAELVEFLLTMYEPDRPFGFRAAEGDGQFSDRPGFLDGASGVALALLSAASDSPPTWDRQLLIG